VHCDYVALPEAVELAKGEEMGRFKLGSTVILLFPKGAVEFDAGYVAASATRLGESLGVIV
jgi:phosphatidylserine decarboxylase